MDGTLLEHCFCVMFWPLGMWDLSPLTRDGTHTPCIGRQSPTTGLPGEVLFWYMGLTAGTGRFETLHLLALPSSFVQSPDSGDTHSRWQCLHRSVGSCVLTCHLPTAESFTTRHRALWSRACEPPENKNYRSLVGQTLWGLSSKGKAHPSIMIISGPTHTYLGIDSSTYNSQPYSQIFFHSEAKELPCRDNSMEVG